MAGLIFFHFFSIFKSISQMTFLGRIPDWQVGTFFLFLIFKPLSNYAQNKWQIFINTFCIRFQALQQQKLTQTLNRLL